MFCTGTFFYGKLENPVNYPIKVRQHKNSCSPKLNQHTIPISFHAHLPLSTFPAILLRDGTIPLIFSEIYHKILISEYSGVKIFKLHDCVVTVLITSITKFWIVIGSLCTYLSCTCDYKHTITWVSNTLISN